MGCHVNHAISKTKEHLFVGHYFLHLSGHIEQIYTNNEMSCVLNLGLITPFHTKSNWDIIYLVHMPPFCEPHFNFYINIYEYAN